MPLRTVLAAVLAAALITAPAAHGEAAPVHEQRAAEARLKSFGSCTGLVRYARRNAIRTARAMIEPPGVLLRRGGGQDDSGAGRGGPVEQRTSAEDFSGTNVQEQGVDEPDIVKSDGTHVFAIAGGSLHAVDARAATPVVLDSLKLAEEGSHTLLLRGDRALVISSLYSGADDLLALPRWASSTRLVEVDVSRPGQLRVINTLDVEGSYLSARLTGETARLVLQSTPRALNAGRISGLRRARLAKWMPRGVLTRRATGRQRVRRLVGCRAVRRTAKFSGVDMVTVLTIDLERGLPAVDSDALMTDAETVYASTGSLYVATHRWYDPSTIAEGEPPDSSRTAIHRFDASQRGSTTYRSSGEVRGFLLSQWSLSEHGGHLRVASTTEPAWWGGGDNRSQSFVTVLREDGGRLAEVGRVGGLGRGERIYAVRFIGDVGYVVTFREVDPLYTLDVSDPATPRVLGELKIRGYSAYLHPVGENLLLGVGQDATAGGARRGTQLSLFDVSDLRNPVRLHERALAAGTSSEVEYDHLAFLYWPATGLTVLPFENWGGDRVSTGAAGFHVSRAGIADLGRISHPANETWMGAIRRSLVIGERVLTVSDSGILASPIDTLRGGAWLPFPR